MKPSISMLAWYLREDKPVCSIKTDAPTISGVRFLADEASYTTGQVLMCDGGFFI